VRDHVRFEVYRGLLRGPEITYASRAGNALDRAALLAELLKSNGVESRFALGRLPAAECEKLLARIFESSPGPTDERDKLTDATLAKSEFLERVRARAASDRCGPRR
jgi:transglutaminase-like putative cysteine protease